MKFKVIRGLRSAIDYKGKPRFAVLLWRFIYEDEVWELVASCTTYPARKNSLVPEGYVLLTDKSSAYKGTGFTSEQVAIGVGRAAAYLVGSPHLVDAAPAGVLNPIDFSPC